MAVVTVKSASITNVDASPRVSTQAGLGGGGRMKKYVDTVALANGDSIASKYLAVRVPSNARVTRVRIDNTAITTCASDIGVYYADIAQDCAVGITPGTVISVAFFGSAVSLATLSAAGAVDVTFESGTYTLALRGKALWEALALTSDPGGKFDIVFTLTAAAASAGTVYVEVETVEM